LGYDLRAAVAATLRHCPALAAEPETRLATIVDFTFKLGGGRLQTSTLRRWVYGGGKILPGFVARRDAETF
jgi:lysozyme